MTVCIAAIYEYGQVDQGVVVVADRRYVDSPSGLAFESPYPKIFSLASHVVGLVADDMDLQSELMRTTTIALAKKQDVTVEDAVDCYMTALMEKTHRHFELNVLTRHGLTFKDFHEKQGQFNKTYTKQLVNELGNHRFPYGVETIIAGVNSSGAEIYVIDANPKTPHGEITESSRTERGFAVIGSGGEPADAQFKLGGFKKEWRGPEVGFLSFVAKKRAQIIGDVGKKTDWRIVNPDGIKEPAPEVTAQFEAEFDKLDRTIKENEEEIRSRLRQFYFIRKISLERAGEPEA